MSPPQDLAVPAALDPSDPLAQLNDAFHEYYAARQRAVLAELGPALVHVDDSLYLRIGGTRHVGRARSRRYHELKVICHVPLAIQAILGDAAGPLDDETRTRLVELQRRATAVLATLDGRGFAAEQRARQRHIVTSSLEFVADVLSRGGASAGVLREFLRGQMPDIRRNIDEGACDQLQTMHATFGAWVRTMNDEQWSQLVVVVGAAHMARTGNLAAQYFSLALGDRWEGRFQQEDTDAAKRVLVSEDVTDEETGFALLATHKFDRRIANAFFGEESRLGRDVLADAAEQQLAAMFGERARSGGESKQQ